MYEDRIKESWIYKELKMARNVRPSFNTKLGVYGGLMYTGMFYILGRGKEPWTFKLHGKYLSYSEALTDCSTPKYHIMDLGQLSDVILSKLSYCFLPHAVKFYKEIM